MTPSVLILERQKEALSGRSYVYDESDKGGLGATAEQAALPIGDTKRLSGRLA